MARHASSAELIPPHLQNAPPEEQAAAGLPAIVGKLQGLKPFPEAAQRLLLLVWDPGHDSNEVTRIIERDPSLTAKVLRLVNSGVFGLRRSCESVSRAIMLLGSRQVAEIAVAQLALGQFDNTGALGKAISDHSQRVAGLCRKLAARRKQLRNVDVFTPGMLHDVGQLLMLQVDQGDYEALLRQTTSKPDGIHELEMAHYGYDHAVLAEHVMHQWRLPEMLRLIIRAHHSPESIDPANTSLREAVAVLRLANAISYAILEDREGRRETLEQLARCPEVELLELDADKLAQLWPDFVELA